MRAIILGQPRSENTQLGNFLNNEFADKKWTHFRAMVAFVKKSGVQHISKSLAEFAQTNSVEIICGIDLFGTSIEGIQLLRQSVAANGNIWILHSEGSSTFHPKVYSFHNETEALIVSGSGNLTQGGLYSNFEVSIAIVLDLTIPEEKAIYEDSSEIFDYWKSPKCGLSLDLDDDLFRKLIENCYILPEAIVSRKVAIAKKLATGGHAPKSQALFPRMPLPKVPRAPVIETKLPIDLSEADFEPLGWEDVVPSVTANKVFYMTLQKTDVGVGQTNDGTSRRSPEVFIPLAARDAEPDFWGWKTEFTEDPKKPGKFDRAGVQMRIGATNENVTMMTWPDKSDFRLRSEALRSAGNVGDILKMEKTESTYGYEYKIVIIPVGSAEFDATAEKCTNPTRNSAKTWGYEE